MNLIDPAAAYRKLRAREQAAIDRCTRLSTCADTVEADLDHYRRHSGEDAEEYGLALAEWARIQDAYAEVGAEIEWICAERTVLDEELAAAGLDWRDYEPGGQAA